MSDLRGCYASVGSGYCRNTFYRTVGAAPGRFSSTIYAAQMPPANRRCKKHWEAWRDGWFEFLFGEEWVEWLGGTDE